MSKHQESGFRRANMWSHFHHKSLWYSSPPSPVVSLQTLYQRKEKTSYRCCLSLLSHQHTSPHHPLSSTHVYVSWTHITIHHSKLTTQGSGWENHCEAILARRLRPVQFPPLDPHNPWTSKVSRPRTLKHIWKFCYRLFLFLIFKFLSIFSGVFPTIPEWPMSWFC